MKSWSIRGLMAAGLMMGLVVGVQSVGAEDWKMEQGGIQPGQMYFGARAGAGKSSQTVGNGVIDASTWGSVVNVQGMYGLNNWLAVGLMLDWDRRNIQASTKGTNGNSSQLVCPGSLNPPNAGGNCPRNAAPITLSQAFGSAGATGDFGSQSAISLIPTVEFRPVHFGPLTPYMNLGIGVNINTTSDPNVSANNTLAFRSGVGVDYMVWNRFAVNTEVAYKRNSGTLNVLGASGDWNNSSVQFLLGGKMFF